jgi:hypothetical protein
MYEHWFVSRQKRKLTTILPAIVAFSDVCVGEVWRGNHTLQFAYEDELGKREITEHGKLRARKTGQGGGGVRTLFKQLKDLGLVFTEEENGKCRMTLIAEAMVRGDTSFVDGMRMQLQKYQYPSATSCKGSGQISGRFKVHPFQFMFRLLLDDRLNHTLHMDEMSNIVIHFADSDNDDCYEGIVSDILHYRKTGTFRRPVPPPKGDAKTYSNIANTFFNYISLTQYIDRGDGMRSLILRDDRRKQVEDFIAVKKYIPNPEYEENYIRAYGRGNAAKDLRDFEKEKKTSQDIAEKRIRQEFVLLSLTRPIKQITSDIVVHISNGTGIDEVFVEKVLTTNYPHGNISDFFTSYRELAHLGRAGATDFEIATVELFRTVFGMEAKHVGPIGNTPDVFVQSNQMKYCGIIDNKAYDQGYSITGDHKRRMTDEYIPNYKQYGSTTYPLAFYSYIASSFGVNMDRQLQEITQQTGVKGSAMPVDLLIDFAEDYERLHRTHADILKLFTIGRRIRLSDVENLNSDTRQLSLTEMIDEYL